MARHLWRPAGPGHGGSLCATCLQLCGVCGAPRALGPAAVAVVQPRRALFGVAGSAGDRAGLLGAGALCHGLCAGQLPVRLSAAQAAAGLHCTGGGALCGLGQVRCHGGPVLGHACGSRSAPSCQCLWPPTGRLGGADTAVG